MFLPIAMAAAAVMNAIRSKLQASSQAPFVYNVRIGGNPGHLRTYFNPSASRIKSSAAATHATCARLHCSSLANGESGYTSVVVA